MAEWRKEVAMTAGERGRRGAGARRRGLTSGRAQCSRAARSVPRGDSERPYRGHGRGAAGARTPVPAGPLPAGAARAAGGDGAAALLLVAASCTVTAQHPDHKKVT